MKQTWKEVGYFWRNKVYILILSLAAVFSYGFTITHYAIGMDDTAIPLYFEEGLAPYVGRWTLFVLNKIFPIAQFTPWMTELLSILVFMVSVTLWCVLFERICRGAVSIPRWTYAFVAAIFLSCPIISEIYVFYLHNGICTGYGLTALSLLCLLAALQESLTARKRLVRLFGAAALLTAALGCYESFVVVFAMGAIFSFFLVRRLYGKSGKGAEYRTGVWSWIGSCAFTGIVSLVFRAIVLAALKTAFGLEKFAALNVAYRSLFSGLLQDPAELIMELKRFWMKFYLNAFVYLPIAVLVVAFLAIGLYSLYYGIRKKDILLPLCVAAAVALPIVMCIIEGIATRYRTGQYIPLVGAFAVLLLLVELYRRSTPRMVPAICFLLLGILLYNQCAEMNKWFYVDYRKYEDVREVMEQVAWDLERGYDTSKPIVFRGAYKVPYEIAKDAYSSFDSTGYRWISRISDLVDPHLKEKYFAENGHGYIFAETPIVSTLQWGVTAFDGTSGQLIEFWRMHGHEFTCETDLNKIEKAEELRKATGMPGYPQDGYIMECDDMIIVNLESQ